MTITMSQRLMSSPYSRRHCIHPAQHAPVFRLPRELLDEIFIQACSDSNVLHAYHSPMTISHVCRWWRQASTSCGALWTNIVLCLRPRSHPKLSHSDPMVNSWLARSQSYPLNVLLDMRDPSWLPLDPCFEDWEEDSHRFTISEMESVLNMFLPHLPRWKAFELRTDTWAPIHHFLSRVEHLPAPRALESLVLQRCNAHFLRKGQIFKPPSRQAAIPLFSHSGIHGGGLKELTLSGVHVDWARSLPPSLVQGLVKLEFKFHSSSVMPSFDEFETILSSCSRLETLTIAGWGPKPDFNGPRTGQGFLPKREAGTRRIVLKRVSTFHLGLVDIQYAMELLSHLHMPRLRYLQLEDVQNFMSPVELDVAPLLAWLLDCQPSCATILPSISSYPFQLLQLESVKLVSLAVSDANCLRNFFASLSRVQEIHLERCSADFISALDLPRHHRLAVEVPCPALDTLRCVAMHCSTSCGTPLFDVLHTRAMLGKGPKHFICENPRSTLTEWESNLLCKGSRISIEDIVKEPDVRDSDSDSNSELGSEIDEGGAESVNEEDYDTDCTEASIHRIELGSKRET